MQNEFKKGINIPARALKTLKILVSLKILNFDLSFCTLHFNF